MLLDVVSIFSGILALVIALVAGVVTAFILFGILK
jgi:hypothetical protein